MMFELLEVEMKIGWNPWKGCSLPLFVNLAERIRLCALNNVWTTITNKLSLPA